MRLVCTAYADMFMWDRQASVTQTGRHAGLCGDLQSHPVPPDNGGPSQRGGDIQGHTPIHPPVCIPKHPPPPVVAAPSDLPLAFFFHPTLFWGLFSHPGCATTCGDDRHGFVWWTAPFVQIQIESFSPLSWQICSQGFRKNRVTLLSVSSATWLGLDRKFVTHISVLIFVWVL